ncbi:MAG: lipid carrier--UDP-N-acetylgalactosaminyltransferase [Alteromonadaceae bacterium]|nr:lipid carrier--UDP-N-acetylgalactosaminyltransferase [Alteromonadaceae bacterium]
MNFYKAIKRLIDIFFSLLLIIIILPIFIPILIIIFFDLRGMPLFYQERAGLHGEKFYVIKFKTMRDITNKSGELLPDDMRMTKLGRLLRKSSLDELPQLLNVLKGDMSFIGPRPFLYEYMNVYSENEKKRHNVRPGISGWAQVNGRNTISWKDKFKLDLYYVENISLSLDLKIVFLTLYKVFKVNDINQKTNLTMEKYNGKN